MYDSRAVLNLDLLQEMQDEFARKHNLALVAVDATGTPITKTSSFTPFCELLRRHPEHRALCNMCDAHGGLQSAIDGKPYAYQCHAGLVDLSAPIRHESHYLGAILCGQVRLPDQHGLNPVVPRMTDWRRDHELLELRRYVPVTVESRLYKVAEELFQLAADVVSACRTDAPLWEDRTRSTHPPAATVKIAMTTWDLKGLAAAIQSEDLPAAVNEIDNLLDKVFVSPEQRLGKQMLIGLEDSLVDLAAQASPRLGFEVGQQVLRHRSLDHRGQRVHMQRVECASYIESLVFAIFDGLYHDRTFAPKSIRDLLNYVERHPTRFITLTQAAAYINCTPAHLSRTFKQHTGRTFVQYLTERRINRACMLLSCSDLPVQTIAARLGFQPAGYFCRIFKREVGQTPGDYRRTSQESAGVA